MNGNSHRILLIEDQTSIREVVADLLREFELAEMIEQANSIEEAREALNRISWDAIITDMSLCDGNILDLIEVMQQQEQYTFPPILLMSGFLFGESEKRARALGIKHILSKPFIPLMLIDSVQHMLAASAEK